MVRNSPPAAPATPASRSGSEAGSRAGTSRGVSEQVEVDLASWSPYRFTGSLPLSFSRKSLENGMRKGVHSAELLSGLGVYFEKSIMDEAVASQEKERRSPSAEEVASLHAFLSHSWANSRWQKYIALLVHFNAQMAYFTSLAASLLTAGAHCIGILSTNIVIQLPCGRLTHEVTMTATPFFVGAATFVLTILFGQTVRRLFEYVGLLNPRYVFLDSLCIDQSDPQLKAMLFSCVVVSWAFEALLLVFRDDFHLDWVVFAIYFPPTIPFVVIMAQYFYESMAHFEDAG